ncbi:MAG: dimethyladenosine transferase [Firmicutes bacterium]|jgi:hypothetical protein|nr:dimethyladenosine transferase [Bacillota bacterium]
MYETTTGKEQLAVSSSKEIAAGRHVIFNILTDPKQHPVLDGQTTVKGFISGERLRLGTKFSMSMKMWAPYHITNTVVEYEEDSLIAWQHFFGHRWRYQLQVIDASHTMVTETFDYSTAKSPLGIKLMGFPQKNLESIRHTLERLAKLAESISEDN